MREHSGVHLEGGREFELKLISLQSEVGNAIEINLAVRLATAAWRWASSRKLKEQE